MTMACNVTRGFCQSAFVLELWLAHLDGWPSLTSLTTKAPIVDYLGTCRFHLNCKTALRVRRHLKKKPIKAKSNGYLLSVHGHAHLTHLVLVVSTLLSSGRVRNGKNKSQRI